MADPKYAGLPGIALDQPDMFETSGMGEVEEEEEEETSLGEPAPVLHLSSLSWLGDLEVGGGGEAEGLVQRYTRLRCDVAELAGELEAMTESAREGEVAGLSLQVTDLGRRLAECDVMEKAGEPAAAAEAKDQLVRDIEALQKKPGAAAGGTQGLYQLYLGGQAQRPAVDLASMEARLAALERTVGQEAVGERRAMAAATEGRTLQYAADNLAAKRSYFQQQHLDHVEGRLAALNLKMNVVGEQKEAVLAAREEDKLSKVSRLVEGQASLATVLPDLLARLEEVDQLGTRAAGWPQVLDTCQQSQQTTKALIGDTKAVVADTRTALESLTSVAAKFDQLQNQLETLKV